MLTIMTFTGRGTDSVANDADGGAAGTQAQRPSSGTDSKAARQ
jgi:hypothetical protein